MTIRDSLSRDLREAFPGLTCDRIDTIWQWVVCMERGKVYLPDADLVNPDEVIVALHCARELGFSHTFELQKIVKNLSAHRKRYLYPKSHPDPGVQCPK